MSELIYPDDDRIENPSDIFEPKKNKHWAWILTLPIILIVIVTLFGLSIVATSFIFTGTNISLVGSEIGNQELQQIEKLIETQLPPKTRGVEFSFSGWQDYRCAAILEIDPDEVEAASGIVRQLQTRPASIGYAGNLPPEIAADQIIAEARGLWADFEYGYAALVINKGNYYLYILWFTR